MSCFPSSSSSSLFPVKSLRLRAPWKPQTLSTRLLPARSSLSDPFVLELAEKLEDSLSLASSSPSPPPLPLQKLRDASSQSLLSKPWPSSNDEPFRFTDTSFLKRSQIFPAAKPSPEPSLLGSRSPSHRLVILDGHFIPSLSQLSSLPEGVFAGGISDVPPGGAYHRVSQIIEPGDGFRDGDLFWDLNGAGAPDLAVIYLPAGARVVDEPIHVVFCSSEGGEAGSNRLTVSSPRVLVVADEGAEVAIVEEHFEVGDREGKCYWTNAVMEIVVGVGGKVLHSYVQRQSPNAAHIKWTFARQESSSTYELVEISTGGRLSRHNLHIQQVGPDTITDLSAFHTSHNNQTQDLHSKLILDHPRGYSRQLHKCIVADSLGQAIFDGNIKVNRFAQQTDAGQLTRTLLLAPRATANVKPNLQIIADDVKCSHGAAISDLEEDQLFYFQARGINLQTARDALVFSFGAEVVARLPYEYLRKAVAGHVKEVLASKRTLPQKQGTEELQMA